MRGGVEGTEEGSAVATAVGVVKGALALRFGDFAIGGGGDVFPVGARARGHSGVRPWRNRFGAAMAMAAKTAAPVSTMAGPLAMLW
jgi:hypothetical protein